MIPGIHRALGFAALLAILQIPLFAQGSFDIERRQPVLVGPSVALAYNVHTFPSNAISDSQRTSIGGWGYVIGVAGELSLSTIVGVQAQLAFESRGGREEYLIWRQLLTESGSVDVKPSPTRTDITYSLLSMELLGRVKLFKVGTSRVSFAVGPSFGLILTGHLLESRRESLPDSSGLPSECYSFEDEGRTVVLYDAPIPNLRSFRSSLKLAGLLDVPLFGESAVCRVGAHYDLELGAMDTEGGWSFNSALLTVGMMFRL